MVCYKYSRGAHLCRGPKDGCYKQHRGLSAAEKLDRDKWEEKQLKAGKKLGYERTAKQANAAAANVSAAPSTPRNNDRSTSSERRRKEGGKSKGRGKGGRGKGKDKVCRVFTETGKCERGKNCWFAATTPNHP